MFGSEPRFEPEPTWTGPRFGPRFNEIIEPNPRSGSRFREQTMGMNLSEPGSNRTFLGGRGGQLLSWKFVQNDKTSASTVENCALTCTAPTMARDFSRIASLYTYLLLLSPKKWKNAIHRVSKAEFNSFPSYNLLACSKMGIITGILPLICNVFFKIFWVRFEFAACSNLNRTYWTWTYGPVQGSANFLNRTQGSGLGSQKSFRNRTDPDPGITSQTWKFMSENSDCDGNTWVRVTIDPLQGNTQGTLSHVVTGPGHNITSAAVTAAL